jgi:hypothetical protein
MLEQDWLSNREQVALVEYFTVRAVDREAVQTARVNPGPLKREPFARQPVGGKTSSFRLSVAADYLGWLYIEGARSRTPAERKGVSSEACELSLALRIRLQSPKDRNSLGRRQSPPVNELERMFQIIEVDHPENPWLQRHVAIRNRLLIHMFYH